MKPDHTPATIGMDGLRAALGLAHLLAPTMIAGRVVRGRLGPGAQLAVRALGVRQLGQALLTSACPTPAVLRLGGAADLLHAATMAGLALRGGRWRGAAAGEAALALGLAGLGLLEAQEPRAVASHA
ncbi:MAG: hypothetical protein ACREN4_08420 [Candidatus Dormibacteria bacterium]